jgi:hypothetical protein
MWFAKDLLIWEEAQREFAKVLLDTKKTTSLEFAQGKFKDWDIKIDCVPDWILTYEVKSDTMAKDTGNFVIETRFKWNPSWIFTSKADYIVYYIKWEWRAQERWELILRLINIEKRETKWGDWRQSTLRVISCDKLPDLFTKLETNEQRGKEDA